jgi:hypothetical protein
MQNNMGDSKRIKRLDEDKNIIVKVGSGKEK